MTFRLSLTLSAEFATDAPTLEILLDGEIVSFELVTATIGSAAIFNYDLEFDGTLPSFELLFNDDSSAETGRSIRIDDISINGQSLNPLLLGLSGDAFANSNAVALNEIGDSTALNAAIADYMFGINEPTLEELGAITHAGTAVSDTLLKGSKNNDVMYGDEGNDKISGLAGDDLIHGGAGIDTIYGHDGNDVIVGGEGNDKLYGRNDDDIIYGGEGSDKICGDDGDDIMNGGAGADNIRGGIGNDIAYGGDDNDVIYGEAGDDTLNGDAGNDKIYGGDDNDTISGGEGNDLIHGDAGDDVIDGGDGKDWLYGGDGADTINGDEGTDRIFGGDGDDILNGGEGQDVIYGDADNDTISGGSGKDWLYGGDGVDTIHGDGGKDRILGGADDDIIYGDGGNDILFGDEGNDTLEGGQGNDVLYASLDGVYTAAVTVESILASDSSISYNATTGNFYKFVTTGANDTTHADAVTDATTNIINGFAAHLVTLSNGAEQTFVGGIINGGQWAWINGSDSTTEGTFTWDAGPESGAGFDGSLSWDGGSVGNTNSGTADNVLIYDGGGDVLYAYAGTNTAYGYIAEWEGSDVLTSASTSGYDSQGETNILNGGIGNDTLYGSMGSDTLNGGADDDSINGGAGVDTVTFETASNGVTVHLGTGTASGDGNDTLDSIENVTGSDFDDSITGDSGSNVILGGAGNDTILGGGGNDTLNGGDGDDVLGSLSVSNTLTVADVLASNASLSYNATTGNFYEFVSSTETWTAADAAAQASTINGVGGHLITINSAAEQTHMSSIADANSHFWSGGSDTGTEGQWDWLDGPEAGTNFWDTGGSTGEFTNWYNGDDGSNSGANDHLLILNNATYSNEWYSYTDTYAAAYMVEWEGADVLASGILVNETSNTVSLTGGDGLDTLYGGTGIDTFVFEAASAYNDIDVVENFVTGVGGDALDISDLLGSVSGAITDWVQFVDSGSDTLVQVDSDGAANGVNFTTVGQINGLAGLDEATLQADGNLIV